MPSVQPAVDAPALQDDIRASLGTSSGKSGQARVLVVGCRPCQVEASNWTTIRTVMSHTSGVTAGMVKCAAGWGYPPCLRVLGRPPSIIAGSNPLGQFQVARPDKSKKPKHPCITTVGEAFLLSESSKLAVKGAG